MKTKNGGGGMKIAEAMLDNQMVKIIEVHLDNTVVIVSNEKKERLLINELDIKPHERRKINYAIGKKEKEKEKKLAREGKLSPILI